MNMTTVIGARARHWHDFFVGETLQTVGRTIESGDVGLFAGLSGDFNPVHTNAVYAADGQFGVRIAHGLLTLAVSSGQMNQTGMFEGTTIGFLGMTDVRFSNPVRFGDTVTTRATITNTRASRSKPDRGVVEMRIEVVNQHDELVLSYDQALLMSGSVNGDGTAV
jgi:3-hydroxybutyryl-CoA dehydratase